MTKDLQFDLVVCEIPLVLLVNTRVKASLKKKEENVCGMPQVLQVKIKSSWARHAVELLVLPVIISVSCGNVAVLM